MDIVIQSGNKPFVSIYDYSAENLVYKHNPQIQSVSLEAEVIKAITSHETTPLCSCVVEGDKVVLALDPQLPDVESLVRPFIQQLQKAGIVNENITILISMQGRHAGLLVSVKDQLQKMMTKDFAGIDVIEHQDKEEHLRYLASTATSTPIMIHEKLIDADVVFPIGLACYDRFYGIRNGNSVLYPGFSGKTDMYNGLRQGHSELMGTEDFPLKLLADEVGWLSGALMTLQVVPSNTHGVMSVYWGQIDQVAKLVEADLKAAWNIPVTERVETVILKLTNIKQHLGTELLVESLARCRLYVQRGGRLIVLSSISHIEESLFPLMKSELKPSEMLQSWGKDYHRDPWKVLARTLTETLDWCHVYLYSGLTDDKVRELQMHPITEEEIENKLAKSREVIMVNNPIYIGSVYSN